MKPNSYYLALSFLLLAAPLPCWGVRAAHAQSPALIETMLKARESMVTIDGIQRFTQSPPTDTHDTAKLQRIRQGMYVQNGAGVIISADGLIVTNFHTIYGSDYVKVTFADNSSTSAEIERLLPQYDLALLQVNTAKPLKPLSFADSDKVELGSEIINIGHSDLLNGTLSAGYIIGVGRSMEASFSGDQSIQIIKVNINLHKGDSGGPVLDRSGELVGMIYAQINSTERPSLAIPSNKIKKLYLEFQKERYNAK